MAKKSTSTSKHKRSKRSSTKEASGGARALSGPRLMERQVEEYIGTYTEGAFPAYKNWTPSTDGQSLMHESYFDFSGYAKDALTVFPSNAGLQDGGYYVSTPVDPTGIMYVIDIMSQERLDHDTVQTEWNDFLNLPGHPETTEDFEQIIYGQFRWMAQSTSFVYGSALTPVSAGRFGSASPTTVEKLWCYRFIIVASQAISGTSIAFNATRFVLGATIAAEKELAFLMRQKRSYELSTQG